ncbi:unnamed protein product [Cylindrotheca closterium]|uniref:Uncharacterized protein n=1 Tax=Cylindrotheca closterium TaxID=2856 RepID=A0AAD2FQZ4_9STRA|nr:unnamed protein product [Cylindrotheca closterium]
MAPGVEEERQEIDQSYADHSIVYENNDLTSSKKKKKKKTPRSASSKKKTKSIATSSSSMSLHDWNVVEKPTNDSSSEFSDDEYQTDLLEEAQEQIKRIDHIIASSVCKKSICSSRDSLDSCSDFDNDDDDNDVVEVAEVSVVIENPPSSGDTSDFEDDDDDDDLEELEASCIEDGVVVEEEDGVVVVHEDDLPNLLDKFAIGDKPNNNAEIAIGKEPPYLGLTMRQRTHLKRNNSLIPSGIEGRTK